MSDDDKARRFRRLADARGLTLSTPDAFESRFTFCLSAGTIVTSRHTALLVKLLGLAKECWGQNGDYDELLCLTAPRDDVFPSISATNVEWKLLDARKDRIEFARWLKDQHLLQGLQDSEVPPP